MAFVGCLMSDSRNGAVLTGSSDGYVWSTNIDTQSSCCVTQIEHPVTCLAVNDDVVWCGDSEGDITSLVCCLMFWMIIKQRLGEPCESKQISTAVSLSMPVNDKKDDVGSTSPLSRDTVSVIKGMS